MHTSYDTNSIDSLEFTNLIFEKFESIGVCDIISAVSPAVASNTRQALVIAAQWRRRWPMHRQGLPSPILRASSPASMKRGANSMGPRLRIM